MKTRASASAWRHGVVVVACAVALLRGGSPAHAQAAIQFYTNKGFTQSWSVKDPVSQMPLVEWGQTIWVRLSGFQAGTPVAVKFRRVFPAVTPPDVSPPDYGFQCTAAHDAGGGVFRVGVDVGFAVNGTPVDPTWHPGVFETARDWTTLAADPEAGAPITPLVGPPTPPWFVAAATPGLWRVSATQDLDGDGTPDIEVGTVNPVYIRILNPLTIQLANGNVPWTAAAPDAAGAVTTAAGGNWENGNPNFGPNMPPTNTQYRVLEGPAGMAGWPLGVSEHGLASTHYGFSITDRSKLTVNPDILANIAIDRQPRLPCRIGNGDLNPIGDANNPPTYWWSSVGAAKTPPTPQIYDLLDYPPIPAANLSFVDVNNRSDPKVTAMRLSPRVPPAQDSNTPVTPTPATAQVRVPQFQPDTVYGTGWPAIDDIPAAADPVRVWVDINNNGLLDVVQDPNHPGMVLEADPVTGAAISRPRAAYEVFSVHAEPYREFNLVTRVNTDIRLAVEETTINLGKHPFGNTLYPLGVEPAVRPFTVKNLGNVNLGYPGSAVQLRVGHFVRIQHPTLGERITGVSLYAPDTENDGTAAGTVRDTYGAGVQIPPQENWGGLIPRKFLWWSFDDNPAAWEVSPGGAFIGGYLLKARPGTMATTLGGQSDPVSGVVQGPRVGVILPFGQPLGTYANRLAVYLDRNGDGMLNCTAQDNAFRTYTPDEPAAEFTLAVTVVDRQLTEEAHPCGIDRPVPGVVGGSSARADSFLKWTWPNRPPLFPADSQPAAARFWDRNVAGHRRLALFWTSNRPDSRAPQPPTAGNDPLAADSYYLYGSRTWEWKTNNAQEWPFWGLKPPGYDPNNPASTANPPEIKLPSQSLFPSLLSPGATAVTERYVSPFIAPTVRPDAGDAPAYLFFQGTAFARQAGGGTAVRASGLFCVPLDAEAQPAGQAVSIAQDNVGVSRHAVRGLSYRPYNNPGVHYLWAFWHGGPENAWQAYFTYSTSGGSSWQREERLPIYGDFTYVSDVMPLLLTSFVTDPATGRPSAAPKDVFHVFFSGFSKFRRSQSVFMACLDPDQLRRGPRGIWRAKIPFAPVTNEVLQNSKNQTFYSRHLEWLTAPYFWPSASGGNRPVFPRIRHMRRQANGTLTQVWASPDPTNQAQMNDPVTGWRYVREANCWTCAYPSYQSARYPDLKGNRVTMYPYAGVVTFDKPLDEGDEVWVDYVPQILAVPANPQREASPCAFVDTRWGPAQSPTPRALPNNQAEFPRTYAERDRLWVFYTHLKPERPSVWYKTMRLAVQLPSALDPKRGPVQVQDEAGPITGFTVDPSRNWLVFPLGFEGRRVTVTYNGGQTVTQYVRWMDETQDAELPIEVAVNEGKVCAFADLAPQALPDWTDPAQVRAYLDDPGTWRVWVFWASSRRKPVTFDGNTLQPLAWATDTDLRYLTLAPRLDFRPGMPPPP